ncbi:lysine--tRNA ligase, partial [Candidatus Pacearchaeota archaeon]|nr:lysine--tRNA ligase [Candidatus Pacearchaeota archaeon]
MAEKFFWADMIADKIIEKNKEKQVYVCVSGITPSGIVHVGNFREVITTELVVRALKDKGKKVRFVYSWDDYDRFRKIPKNVKSDFEKYLGNPICEVPSPFNEKKDYAKYFEEKFEQELEKVGIAPKFIRQCEMYKKCKYAELIKKSLENKKKIMEILNKYRKEPLSEKWFPIKIYCEKCKKDSTKILSINEWKIKYSCECGHEEEFDFRKKGLVKLVWRVDWPMRWYYEKVDFEPGGADHSAPGSSFDTGKQIIKEIFDYPVPLYYMYQNVGIKGGEKFSSSKGNVLTISELEEIYEPEIIRYLFAGTRPNRSFQISFDNDVIKIYEDYDALEKKYYNKQANAWEKRIYEMSQVKKVE